MLPALAPDRRVSGTGAFTGPSRCGLGHRRDPHRAPDARPLPRSPRSPGDTATQASRTGARGRARRGDQVLPVAARRLAGWRSAGARARGRGRRRLASPRPAVHRPRRLRPMLLDLGKAFDQDSYTPFGSSSRRARPSAPARAVTFAIGAALLVGCWRDPASRWRSRRPSSSRRSCGSTTTPSPRSPSRRPSEAVAVWFVPLVTWGLLSAGIGAGNAWAA